MSIGGDQFKQPAAESGGLGLAAPWPMPQWLPDETFFSLASRYHAVSGNRLAAQTNLALFGVHRGGSQHDFPTHLGQFTTRTEGHLGSVESIAAGHTILPFYLPCRSTEDAAAAVEALAGSPSGMLKYRLGILTSRFRANHPLKACQTCLAEDAATHGVTYWHRTHQLPGRWVCLKHAALLQVATTKSTGVQRFGWLLPSAEVLRPAIPDGLGRERFADLERFARLVDQWARLAPGSVTEDGLAAAYRSVLSANGLLKDRAAMAQAYNQAVSRLRLVPELDALPSSPQAALHQVNRWVFAPRGGTHPLRHLSFIFWLFPEWPNFWSTYLRPTAAAQIEDGLKRRPESIAVDPRKSALVELIRSGTAATAAAKLIGVDTGTAKAWAAAEGLATGRRPKTLKGNIYIALIADLTAGTDKSDAACRNGVSVQTVTRVLRTEVGLHEVWRSARFDLSRAQARTAWTEVLQTFAADGIAAVRRHEPAAYAWLYRNDRDWLAATCADASPAPSRHGTPRLDWADRDSRLAVAVRQAAATLVEGGQAAPLKLWQLYQLVPELKAKLGALDRLPVTRKVISEVTRPRKQRKASAGLL